ncbi:FecR family protein [Chitinophaga sp. 30R24]|uniref:FecR family protein n=1 Tax=Chitinophaga sp. 30R24 TaxID=3248838 RepID=UPI003B90F0E3
MSSQPDRLQYLLRRYLDGCCTKGELKELYAYIASGKEESLHTLLEKELEATKPGVRVNEVDWDKMFRHIIAAKPVAKERMMGSYWKYVAAVLMLLLVAQGIYHYMQSRNTAPRAVASVSHITDVVPGSNKATLTLADGSTVTLDSMGNQLLQQGSTAIHQQGGALRYQAQGGGNVLAYNTLTTPRGGQFQVILPDGTKVWLNATSSLKFPVAFTGSQRDVTLKGEAYFEVAHNDKMPFRVLVEGMEIKDLGTHFNVMAYGDEATVATTLLEGAVIVSDGGKGALLKPGQQAIGKRDGSSGLSIQQADVDHVIAWKNGEFSFNHTSIYEIMRQVSRWYDVDVYYEDAPDVSLSGNISKHVNVSEVFKMLELAGNVKFKIENRKATVMKQY